MQNFYAETAASQKHMLIECVRESHSSLPPFFLVREPGALLLRCAFSSALAMFFSNDSSITKNRALRRFSSTRGRTEATLSVIITPMPKLCVCYL